MATVYLAQDLKHDRQVAIKVLRSDVTASLGPERFLREVKIAANLQHPHVLPLYDSGQAGGLLYYVMPYVQGTNLRQKLIREGELPIADAVRILRDIADAIAFAHQHGVVHRDIKPENVMLSGRHAMVTDFGVAKALTEATGRQTLTTAGVALGTPTYMSPEQAAADPNADHRADIYAFGVVAYELLAGRPPFTGPNPQAVLAAHVTSAVEPVTNHRPSIPPALATLVMKCLEKKPADRWQSADELIPALEAVLTPSGGVTPTATQPLTAGSRRGVRGGMIAAVAVLVLAGVGWLAFRRLRPAAPRIERLAVIPFENRTGNPAHDELGLLVADWINRGLLDARLAEVVPGQVVTAAIAKVGQTVDEAKTTRVARETGATKLISGAYYAAGDSVRFQAELIDVSGNRSLAAVDPVTARPVDAMGAIERVRQRTLGALALWLDPVWGRLANGNTAPPSLEAFRLAVRAGEAFWLDLAEAESLHRQALAVDTTWQYPRIQIATVLSNQNRYLAADSVLRLVEASNHPLSQWDRLSAAWLRAQLDGNFDAAYRLYARDSATIGEGTARQQWGFECLKLNRPAEALGIFSRVKPRSLEMAGVPQYWWLVEGAHHMLGNYQAALAAIREGRGQYPQSFWLAKVEAATLAAVGRPGELSKAVEAARNLPPDRWGGMYGLTYGHLLSDVAAESVAHGDSAGGRVYAERAVAWYAARPAAERNGYRYDHILVLFQAGRLADAAAALEPRCPLSHDGLPCLGWTGVLAARRGDSTAARHQAEAIESLRLGLGSFEGDRFYWLAAIAAASGDLDRGVEQLREAFSRGKTYNVDRHRDPLLQPLRARPAFTELLRPKG